MGTIDAVLLDTVSIQQYVFGSNRLKENLGGSRLVKNIFDKCLQDAVMEALGNPEHIPQWDAWKPPKGGTTNIPWRMSPSSDFEVGYIGGGNALLFFRRISGREIGKEFLQHWTRRLLLEAPGIQTAVAVETFEDETLFVFKEFLSKLFAKLTENKNRFSLATVIPKFGITTDCAISGHSQDVWHDDAVKGRYISAVSKAKMEAANNPPKDMMVGELKGHQFTDQLDQLGQTEGQSYIAVVHIDGNSMGDRFIACSDLSILRSLSVSVDDATRTAFQRLLEEVVEQLPAWKKEGWISPENILPVRPIIMGGDDLTFVTDGRLGVYLAKTFLSLIAQGGNLSDGKPFSACAGVAIVKTGLPFYRAYRWSEELCQQAKKSARESKKATRAYESWLKFQVFYGSRSGSAEEIEKQHVSRQGLVLPFGPYKASSAVPADMAVQKEKSLEHLLEGIRQFSDDKRWPRSKVKDLREALMGGKVAMKNFTIRANARGIKFPNTWDSAPASEEKRESVYENYCTNGFNENGTPYFDMIELMEFYPSFLMRTDLVGTGGAGN